MAARMVALVGFLATLAVDPAAAGPLSLDETVLHGAPLPEIDGLPEIPGVVVGLLHRVQVLLPASGAPDSEPFRSAGAATVVPAAVLDHPGLLFTFFAALAGILAWLSPAAKTWLPRILAAPFYSHLSRHELLAHPVRARVFEIVKATPGIAATEIARAAGASWSATVHHLSTLERGGFVVSIRQGRFKRYFENGGRFGAAKEAIGILHNPTSALVFRRVSEAPGRSLLELSGDLGLSPQATHWHVDRLAATALVVRVRDGRAVRHFVAEDSPAVASSRVARASG
ncbi:MAG: winged helix-turn-helix transcriptional regulator [Methanobacteriota archaeon]